MLCMCYSGMKETQSTDCFTTCLLLLILSQRNISFFLSPFFLTRFPLYTAQILDMFLVSAVEELFRPNDPNDRQKSGDSRSVLHCAISSGLHNVYVCTIQCFDSVYWVLGRASGPWKWSDEVLAWLSDWSEVQIVCIWSGWCHCFPKPCIVKIPDGFTFLVLVYSGYSEKEAIKWVSVCWFTYACSIYILFSALMLLVRWQKGIWIVKKNFHHLLQKVTGELSVLPYVGRETSTDQSMTMLCG